jgi:hypothetical protein
MVERPAVNGQVLGSSPSRGVDRNTSGNRGVFVNSPPALRRACRTTKIPRGSGRISPPVVGGRRSRFDRAREGASATLECWGRSEGRFSRTLEFSRLQPGLVNDPVRIGPRRELKLSRARRGVRSGACRAATCHPTGGRPLNPSLRPPAPRREVELSPHERRLAVAALLAIALRRHLSRPGTRTRVLSDRSRLDTAAEGLVDTSGRSTESGGGCGGDA